MKSKRFTKVEGDTVINLAGDDPYLHIYTEDKNLLKYLQTNAEPFTYDWDGKTVAEYRMLKSNLMFSEAKKKGEIKA